MKVFIGTGGVPLGSPERSTLGGISYIHEIGLQAMEVEFVRGVKMDIASAKECGRLASKLGVKLSVHAPYFINLCSGEKAKLEASKKRILDSVERAFFMNADVVVFHPGYYGKLDPTNAYLKVKEACEELVSLIKEKGWEKVKLGLETTGKVSQFGTLEENVRISKEVKGCVPVIDWAHIYARNGGKIDFEEIIQKVSSLKLDHLHTHFSGMLFKPVAKGGNERKHLNLTEGAQPDYRPLVKLIAKKRISVTFISESPNLEGDGLYLKRLFEEEGYR